MVEVIEELMMPGEKPEPHLAWQDRANCVGDERFTQKEPPLGIALEELEEICLNCPVFAKCLKEHNYPDVMGVFAAGEWRYEK